MRSMWKGSITFGLVSVPVQLFKAVEEHSGLSAHMVHAKDGGAIKLRRVCEAEGVEVPYAEIAKSYETPDGREAVITAEDLKQLPLPSKRIIDVLGFVDADTIDPLRLSSPYYIGVQAKSPAKPYVLLREALAESGRIAVTKVTLSTRETLAVLRVHGDLLILQTLLWPDEIREPDFAAPTPEAPVRAQELKMARSLMDTLSEDFDVDGLHDDYAQALGQLVDAKAADAPAPSGGGVARGGQVLDLMEALRRSVAEAKGETPAEAAPKAARKVTTPKQPAKKAAAKKAAAKKTTKAS